MQGLIEKSVNWFLQGPFPPILSLKLHCLGSLIRMSQDFVSSQTRIYPVAS